MTSQAPSDLLHRPELAPHGSCAPRVEELPGPRRALVLPESQELLAEEIWARTLFKSEVDSFTPPGNRSRAGSVISRKLGFSCNGKYATSQTCRKRSLRK